VSLDVFDYDGPLGAFEEALARRRIAVVNDRAGRICLVRPDSVVLEPDASGRQVRTVARDPRAALIASGLQILSDDPPARTAVTARRRPPWAQRRWRVRDLEDMVTQLPPVSFGHRLNHVYLADGISRHFRLVGAGGAAGTPGITVPSNLHSTVQPAVRPRDLPAPLDLGRPQPNVLILDTGLRTIDAHTEPEHPWLQGHVSIHTPWRDAAVAGRFDDEDEPDDDHSGRLDVQAGHGTFITGVVRQLCPDAIIHHRGVLTSFGDGDDASVREGVRRAIDEIPDEVHIAVMAFGTYGADDEPPVLAQEVAELQARGVLVVAAAGNDATTRPFFPAALPGVIAVGALDGDGRAAFSNAGAWVDACTPASDVVSTFFTEFDDHCECCGQPTDEYRGWARWSGTSFGAPKVAGVIAQEMYLRQCTAAEAWARIRARARFRLPDLGIVINA
jgi:hypothetical protein